MVVTASLVEKSSRTTAACSECEWSSGDLLADLSVRVAAGDHSDRAGHTVAVLTNTVTLHRPRTQIDAAHSADVGAS